MHVHSDFTKPRTCSPSERRPKILPFPVKEQAFETKKLRFFEVYWLKMQLKIKDPKSYSLA